MPPQCIAVSPDGVLRFWQNVNYASSYVEKSLDLGGQQCLQLLSISVSSENLLQKRGIRLIHNAYSFRV